MAGVAPEKRDTTQMKELKFFVITDTHYFKNSLGAYGDEYERFMDFEQKCFAETENINKAIFEYLEKADEADIILIAGDLSFNGEKESHKDFSALLENFEEKTGKKIFVLTAGHDSNEHPFAYDGGERISPEGTKFTELYDFYRKFGYDRAIEFNKEHMSYVAELSDDVRLLVICNDTAERNNADFSEEFFEWIEAQAKKAQQDGKMMIAMEHYPVIPGQPIFGLIADARQKGGKRIIETLADNGVHLIFTGHMHNQSINVEETEKGNLFYDVCTGSAIGCPAFMRLATIKDENTVEIESIPVPEFEWDKKGMTGEEYLKVQFEKMIRTYIDSMYKDPKRFLDKLRIKDTALIEKLVVFGGKKLSKMTIGGFAKLFCVRVDKSIRKNSFVNFAIDIVRYVFEGNQPYKEGTPEGDAILKFVKRIKPFVKNLKDAHGNEVDLYELIKHTVGNYGLDDYNAVLKLKK